MGLNVIGALVRPSLYTFAAFLLTGAPSDAEPPLELSLPIACSVGHDCFIQNFVDQDTGPETRDYACGTLTYDGHKGTDFRVANLPAARRTAVLAAASGAVSRVRDGMEDISVRQGGIASLKGKDCGNGVVIAHAGGWETQYCHLAKGSITVRPGDKVQAGQEVGRVGLSGRTEFPHVHLTVRFDGNVVDPFAFGALGRCNSGEQLWKPELKQQLTYRPSFIVHGGFADRRIDRDDVERGVLDTFRLTPESPVLLAAVLLGGVRKGDRLEFSLEGPEGTLLANKTIDSASKSAAENFLFIGRPRPASGWPKGIYKASFRLSRQDFETDKVFYTEY